MDINSIISKLTQLTQKQKIAIAIAIALVVVLLVATGQKREQDIKEEMTRLTPIEKIHYPSRQSFYISFPKFVDTEVRPGQNYTVDYEIPYADKLGKIDVVVESYDGYNARVEQVSNSKGVIHITTPDTLKYSEVYLIASRKNETPVIYSINMRKKMSVSIPSTVFAAKNTEEYPVDLPLGLTEYIVSIPDSNRYWIESAKGDTINIDAEDVEKAQDGEESFFERILGFFEDLQEWKEDLEAASDVNIPIGPAKEPEKHENIITLKIYTFAKHHYVDSAARYSIVRLLNEEKELQKTIFVTQTNVSKLSLKVDKPGTLIDKIYLGDYESVTSIDIDGVMDSADFSILREFKDLTHLDLADVNIKKMSGYLHLRQLESVILPKTLTEITDNVFKGSLQLRHVDFSNIETIGNSVFNGCKLLKNIKLPNTLKHIGDFAFSGCSEITEIDIPSSVDSIGRSAFSRCTALSQVKLNDGLKAINHYAFGECSSLRTMFIPSSVEYIGERVFYGCNNLTRFSSKLSPDGRSLVVNNELRAVTTQGLTRYVIPAATTSIGEFVFFRCENLTDIVIPQSVTKISNSAFFGCSGLKEINIPNSVQVIKTTAFAYCTNLLKIRFPESVSVVESWAFDGCSNLAEVELSSLTTKINEYAFSGCISLVSFNIPEQTDNIGNYAFSGTGLVKVDMPERVSTLGRSVFQLCLNLEEVNCPSTTPPVVDSILGESLHKLNSIYVPKQSVKNYASSIGWKEHSLKGADSN